MQLSNIMINIEIYIYIFIFDFCSLPFSLFSSSDLYIYFFQNLLNEIQIEDICARKWC